MQPSAAKLPDDYDDGDRAAERPHGGRDHAWNEILILSSVSTVYFHRSAWFNILKLYMLIQRSLNLYYHGKICNSSISVGCVIQHWKVPKTITVFRERALFKMLNFRLTPYRHEWILRYEFEIDSISGYNEHIKRLRDLSDPNGFGDIIQNRPEISPSMRYVTVMKTGLIN